MFTLLLVRIGDELVSVNGRSLVNITTENATSIFDSLPAGPVQLQISRHPQVHKRTIFKMDNEQKNPIKTDSHSDKSCTSRKDFSLIMFSYQCDNGVSLEMGFLSVFVEFSDRTVCTVASSTSADCAASRVPSAGVSSPTSATVRTSSRRTDPHTAARLHRQLRYVARVLLP